MKYTDYRTDNSNDSLKIKLSPASNCHQYCSSVLWQVLLLWQVKKVPVMVRFIGITRFMTGWQVKRDNALLIIKNNSCDRQGI